MKNSLILTFSILFTFLFQVLVPSSVYAQSPSDWYMAGANPQRTSWVTEEVKGSLQVEWYRPIEPYIHYKFQPVAAFGKIFISTARGLYAINATNGDLSWIYPTKMPLGHSPTVINVNGSPVVYVGGYDRKIHAINGNTGAALDGYTAFSAGSGFETNPLVIEGIIYAGNRDGNMYALNATTGEKLWHFATGGPILFSAAYKNNVIYFASNDSRAYALNATNGALVWKSAKLPGAGFHSYWPVIYNHSATGKDYVSFTTGENYLYSIRSLTNDDPTTEYTGMPDNVLISDIKTDIPGNWVSGTAVLDAKILTDHFEIRPYQRFVIILDAATGTELTFDSDGDGKAEYAPFTWSGVTSSGTKYPAIVSGFDNVYYQQTGYRTPGWISRGGPVGWKLGTQYISLVVGKKDAFASDEPTAYSAGGKVLYTTLCCDREAYIDDISIPYGQSNRSWTIYGYNLAGNSLAPGYQQMYNSGDSTEYNNMNGWQNYSGRNQSKNGEYGKHSTTQSPAVPYAGRLYMLRGNSLMAFKPNVTGSTSPLPLLGIQQTSQTPPPVGQTMVKQRLESEIQRIINSGHLRPGYTDTGFSDLYGHGGYLWHNNTWDGESAYGEIFDHFANPADTVYTLLLAYPQLSSTLQQQVKTYLQTHYGPGAPYDITNTAHIGWGAGAQREIFDTPPEAAGHWGQPYKPPLTRLDKYICDWCGYGRFPQFNFYAAWKYVQIIGNNDKTMAQNIFNTMKARLETPLDNYKFERRPYWLNWYINGYRGYMELERLAGIITDISQSTKYSAYQNMLNLKVSTFQKDTPYRHVGANLSNWQDSYHNTLTASRNFIGLTPELADFMKQNLSAKVREAVTEYDYVTPYWFVSKFDVSYAESTFQPIQEPTALFLAKAWILNEPYDTLSTYLDVPAFEKGDLFYIQNLVAALNASSGSSGSSSSTTSTPTTTPSPDPLPGDINKDNVVNILDYTLLSNAFGNSNSEADINNDGIVNIQDYVILSNNFGKTGQDSHDLTMR
jgi:hypothetical protein